MFYQTKIDQKKQNVLSGSFVLFCGADSLLILCQPKATADYFFLETKQRALSRLASETVWTMYGTGTWKKDFS